MTLALVTNSPIDQVARFTLRQVQSFMRSLPAVAPLLNPFAGGEDGKRMTDPGEIRAFALSAGVKRG